MAEYIVTKYRLFANQSNDDFAVLNADDEIMSNTTIPFAGQKYYFSTMRRVKGCYASSGKVFFCKNTDGVSDGFICNISDIKIAGEHNIYNALAATLACLLYNIPKESIVKTLQEFSGIRHRLEFVRELDGVKYYNDSKGTNIDSTLKAALSMSGETTLILGGSDKGYEYDALFIGLPSNISRTVAIGQTKRKLINAAARCGFKNLYEADTFKNAVQKAREITPCGGNILLSPACASFDMFRNFEQRGDAFVEIVQGFK